MPSQKIAQLTEAAQKIFIENKAGTTTEAKLEAFNKVSREIFLNEQASTARKSFKADRTSKNVYASSYLLEVYEDD